MSNRRMIASVCWIVLGLALMGAHYAGMTDDYWNGMGTALLVVGVLQMIRHIRYRTDEAYQAHVEVEAKDERNRFIAGRAWAWAGYSYVFIATAASMIYRLAGDPTCQRSPKSFPSSQTTALRWFFLSAWDDWIFFLLAIL